MSALGVFWPDPDFDPAQSAFYYVRVIETPESQRLRGVRCAEAGLHPQRVATPCQQIGQRAYGTNPISR